MARKSSGAANLNPNELTIDNSALVLIDHQPAVALCAPSLRTDVLVNNVAGLARSAKLLQVPTVLTTVGARGSILADPIFKEISEVFPQIVPIDRTSTHAWSHPDLRGAIEATGRRKLIMAGILTEVCLAQSVLAALKEEFDVYFVSDCSAGGTLEAHEDAKLRMSMAGAKPINWIAVTAEWAPDYTSPERAAVAEVWRQRGGAPAMLTDFTMAQIEAGLVRVPESLRQFAGEHAKS
jgi:nicotinamidase-related amidase